jgi:hypothetical protein
MERSPRALAIPRLVVLLMAGVWLLASCAPDATTQDAESLVSAVEGNYPYLGMYQRQHGEPWSTSARRNIAGWKQGKYKDQTDLFQDMLAGLNGHTGLVLGGHSRPATFSWPSRIRSFGRGPKSSRGLG